MAARARRPRKTDCDPSTDFNLCAFEREYSIEAARHPGALMDVPASAGGVKGQRPSAVADATLDPVLVASPVQLRDAGRIAAAKDLRLTGAPLHTRPSERPAKYAECGPEDAETTTASGRSGSIATLRR
jgi:hypothetical protein